jgi:hypothetical protein
MRTLRTGCGVPALEVSDFRASPPGGKTAIGGANVCFCQKHGFVINLNRARLARFRFH